MELVSNGSMGSGLWVLGVGWDGYGFLGFVGWGMYACVAYLYMEFKDTWPWGHNNRQLESVERYAVM